VAELVCRLLVLNIHISCDKLKKNGQVEVPRHVHICLSSSRCFAESRCFRTIWALVEYNTQIIIKSFTHLKK
jgi:hypothetical protein